MTGHKCNCRDADADHNCTCAPSPSAEAAQPVAEPVEWLWYGEADGKQHISFGRWQSHESQHRYKYADIQATEHDHPSQPQGELREALEALLDIGPDTEPLVAKAAWMRAAALAGRTAG